MLKVMIIEWEGSSFETDRTPRPQALINVGFVVAEDDISITLASHVRTDVDEDNKAIGYSHSFYKVCIRRAQIIRKEVISTIEQERID